MHPGNGLAGESPPGDSSVGHKSCRAVESRARMGALKHRKRTLAVNWLSKRRRVTNPWLVSTISGVPSGSHHASAAAAPARPRGAREPPPRAPPAAGAAALLLSAGWEAATTPAGAFVPLCAASPPARE